LTEPSRRKRKKPIRRKPHRINWRLILGALAGGPMTVDDLNKATGIPNHILYPTLLVLTSKGYVAKEGGNLYRITPEGEVALRGLEEGERILREEVIPQLKRAIELGFSADYIMQMIHQRVWRVIGRRIGRRVG
jgi:DNA-binding PadR family transcriptional regulator